MEVSSDEKFWQEVIDNYYKKYSGIREWHNKLIYEAQSTGRIVIPSGRYYPIIPDFTKRNPWPLTIIKNYPVQGFGADLVKLARLRARQLLGEVDALLVSTIHDSIVADTRSNQVERVARSLLEAVEDVPRLCKEVWGYDFKLPLTAEVQYGKNKADMEQFVF